ncbi:MAG TPA: S1/P1 nuclease [Accumulibacter sp.]|nr:S1/P1 nuclease [Accumulibacter sp.]HQC79525.1 S1/P1 nuclease [Accumulibacter sp.]
MFGPPFYSPFHPLFRLMLLTFLAFSGLPAFAWNTAGHRLVATIAWECLDSDTRSTVADILRQHPDHASWQARGGTEPGLTAFLAASTWPDDIRKDPRFYNAGEEQPTVLVAGFPDMERRRHWHYVDHPIGLVTGDTSTGTLDRQLPRLIHTLGSRQAAANERAYALPWLIHLLGDAHQPLHTASRYDADGRGDRGGNELAIVNPFDPQSPVTNLHRYWDSLPGPPWLRDARLESIAKALMASYPPPLIGTPRHWLAESRRIAENDAYPFNDAVVPTISAAFHQRASEIARRRIADAGYRLAELLQRLLSHDGSDHACVAVKVVP